MDKRKKSRKGGEDSVKMMILGSEYEFVQCYRYQKELIIVWLENRWKVIVICKGENPLKHSEEGQYKYFQKTSNSTNAFILSLVMLYVGSCF